jgi:diacylglycerol kinase (ATP)
MRLILVANANASGVEEADDVLAGAHAALAARGAEVEAHATGSVAELRRVLAEAAGRRVVLLGGDGSLHAAANLGGAYRDLALLPAGGANNVARCLGIPLELDDAAALAVEGGPRSIDLIEVRGRGRTYLAVEGVSVGVHAVARAHYRASNSADVVAALRAAAEALRRFSGTTVTLRFDGRVVRTRVAQLFVANFPLYAFGLDVAPDARPDDGSLEVVARRWTRRSALLPMIIRMRRGTDVASRHTRTWTVERITIEPGASPVVADSVTLGRGRAELTVRRGALAVVAP